MLTRDEDVLAAAESWREAGRDVTIATVDWGNEFIPSKINVANLCRIRERGFSHD